MRHKFPRGWTLLSLFTLLIVSLVLGIFFGAFSIPSYNSWQNLTDEKWKILLNLRIPRVFCCALVGALLACCGIIAQTLLRNPLACPYTLGISQLISLVLFSFLFLSFSSAAAIVVLMLCFFSLLIKKLGALSTFNNNIPLTLILLGLALGTFCSSIILALQFVLDGISLMQMTRWLMGSLSVVGIQPLLALSFVFLLLFLCAYKKSEDLDWLCFGDEFALSRGVAVRKLTFIFTALLCLSVAVVVWTVGPIGFIGLIIPHIARMLGFVKHKELIVVSSLLGASFLCLSDVLSRTLFAPIESPVGVVTGIIGTPAFVWLLISSVSRQH